MDRISRKEAIQKYYGDRFETIWRAAEHGACSQSDLWFTIPNGWKRMHGFSVSRTFAKRKSTAKKKRRRRIAFAVCFWVMQEKINEVLPNTVETTFAAFVDVKSVPFGDVSTS